MLADLNRFKAGQRERSILGIQIWLNCLAEILGQKWSKKKLTNYTRTSGIKKLSIETFNLKVSSECTMRALQSVAEFGIKIELPSSSQISERNQVFEVILTDETLATALLNLFIEQYSNGLNVNISLSLMTTFWCLQACSFAVLMTRIR